MNEQETDKINYEIERIIDKKIRGLQEIVISIISWILGGVYLCVIFFSGWIIEPMPDGVVLLKGFMLFSVIGIVVCIGFPLYFFWVYCIEKFGIFQKEDST